MNSKKTVWWMILFGIVRHVLTIGGAWLVARGLIDEHTRARIVSEGVTDTVGWLLIAGAFAWSWLQKQQAWEWVRTALHLPNSTPVSDVPKIAPGPDMPL